MKTPLRRTEPYKMLKTTTKPLGRRVLIEEGLAKSSKKQRSENTNKWHLCKAGSFSHRRPLPLRELHSTGETIVWRDPRGSSACLPPVYDCVWNHPATGCDMWTTPKKHTKRRETLGNAKQNKTTRRTGYKVYGKTHPRKAFRIKDRASLNAEQNKKH